jgi:hypothetical protein
MFYHNRFEHLGGSFMLSLNTIILTLHPVIVGLPTQEEGGLKKSSKKVEFQ